MHKRAVTAPAYSLKILIVDNVPADHALLSKRLKLQQHEVLIAEDGKEALARARHSLPDLILLDICTPRLDGLEVCRQLKAAPQTKDIPVILMTTLPGLEDVIRWFAVGGVDFIVKPFHIPEVMARISTHLALRDIHYRHALQNIQLQQEIKVRTAAEAELRKARNELESRIVARTRELEKANAVLVSSREKLRQLSAHLETAREEERKHIAMEIHDELGQLLTALKIDVSLLAMRLAGNSHAEAKLNEIRHLVERTINMVRQVANHLRPAALNYGIVAALEWLTEDLSRRSSTTCRFHLQGREPALDDQQATTVFRIAQESLTNVARHANASVVELTLTSDDTALTLTVHDNGTGFDPLQAALSHSYGLVGMRERAKGLGAKLHIQSSPNAGSTISLTIPRPYSSRT